MTSRHVHGEDARTQTRGDGIGYTLDNFAEDTGGRGHGEMIWY
jgi:hypothetical protein